MIKYEKGFTLLEVIIAMTLFSIVLLVGNQMLFSGLKAWIHGENQIDVVQNLRSGMDSMTDEIRSAVRVKTANSKYIVITVPKADYSTVDIRYQYDSVDKELERKEGSSSPQPVSSQISGLSFTYYGDPINMVAITLRGQRKNGSEIILNSKVSIRTVR